MTVNQAQRDASGAIITYGGFLPEYRAWNYPLISAPTAFIGGTPNARGADAGTSDPLTLFTVTGAILIKLFGVVSVAGAGALATISVGTVANTTTLLPVTLATDMALAEIWVDATPTTTVEPVSSITEYIVTADIKEFIATANVTSGNIYYVASWFPLTPTATLVSSYPV